MFIVFIISYGFAAAAIGTAFTRFRETRRSTEVSMILLIAGLGITLLSQLLNLVNFYLGGFTWLLNQQFNSLALLGGIGALLGIPGFFPSVNKKVRFFVFLFSLVSAGSLCLFIILGQFPGLGVLIGVGSMILGLSLPILLCFHYVCWLKAKNQMQSPGTYYKRWILVNKFFIWFSLLVPFIVVLDILNLARSVPVISSLKVLPLFTVCICSAYLFVRVPRESSSSGDGPQVRPEMDFLLTQREKQVASLVLEGYTYRECAAKLDVAPSTVKSHILKVYEKTGAGNKIELMRFLSFLK